MGERIFKTLGVISKHYGILTELINTQLILQKNQKKRKCIYTVSDVSIFFFLHLWVKMLFYNLILVLIKKYSKMFLESGKSD